MTAPRKLPHLQVPWRWSLGENGDWVARRPPNASGSIGSAEVSIVDNKVQIYEETANIPSAPLSVIFAVASANLSTVSL